MYLTSHFCLFLSPPPPPPPSLWNGPTQGEGGTLGPHQLACTLLAWQGPPCCSGSLWLFPCPVPTWLKRAMVVGSCETHTHTHTLTGGERMGPWPFRKRLPQGRGCSLAAGLPPQGCVGRMVTGSQV
ncbi:zona pellucida sperm-binding protein 4-like [Platysternon megacephalum]|uniref:Zona pellucida sperm-binding protein 4-like n=1 Tax=Platysternon megacephalum TaxID=55544 RepID=A0A4D9EE77_9SAUR|nr:zona pellucida sperm-binding protein 4-like [Platysternon megacephalum]